MSCINKKKVLLGLFFLALGLFFLREIESFELSFPLNHGYLHPMEMPQALIYLWCICSVIYIFVPRQPANLQKLWSVMPRVCAIILCIMIFILALQYFGFVISGTTLLIFIFFLIGFKSIGSPFLAFFCIEIVWALFTYMMKMPLPEFNIF